MGKILKPILAVAAIAIAFVPGVGPALSGAIVSLGGGTFGALAASELIIGGILTLGAMSALGIATKALGLGPSPPKASPSTTDRLRATIDPRAPRKIVFGETAAANDVAYQEFFAPDQDYLDMVIILGSHAITSIDEIWLDQELGWSGSSGVASKFAGYFWVWVVLEGSPSTTFTLGDGTNWNPANGAFLTGCSYIVLRFKLSGNNKKAESPFASSVTSRITTRVHAAPLYDPRQDSTNGGSGTHRPDDQSTWVYSGIGRNPALQLLWYLLGWKINGKLAVGLGLPAARIDMESFIAAANICEETVSLAVGGTEARYRSDGIFSEADDPSLVFENLLASMNGVLRDAGGRLALDLLVNDLDTYVELSDADVIGDAVWIQTPPINESFNVVRGRYVDAGDNSLYQLVDYPDVSLDSLDGIDRPATFDLPLVQSPSQAQRLAKQYLQRAQYPGTFAADFMATGWKANVGRVVSLTFPALGFSSKLFRVIEHTIRMDGVCPMVLREEHANIYAWDEEETPAVVAASPILYDPIKSTLVQAIGNVEDNAAWTERYPNPAPDDRPPGGIWWDEYLRPWRLEGDLLEFDSESMEFDGEETSLAQYVLVQDGAVTSGLALDGTVNADKVTTTSIVNDAVTQNQDISMVGTLTGSGAYTFQEAAAYTVDMEDDGTLIVIADIGQSYASGTFPQAWEVRIKIDGNVVKTKGGAGFGSDTASISGSLDVSAGDRDVSLEWRGDNTNLSLSSASAIIFKRLR